MTMMRTKPGPAGSQRLAGSQEKEGGDKDRQPDAGFIGHDIHGTEPSGSLA